MRRDLQGRRILITGASTGIGRSLAEQAAQARARVVLAARSADKLDELAQSLRSGGADALAVPADVTSEEDRGRLLQTVVEHLGGLDVLINNAGVSSFGHFADSSEDLLRRIMEVNFFGPAELMRLAIPILSKGQQPAIVNISSMCGRRGMPAWSEYSASKFALCGLTEAGAELVRFNIDVLLVVPGLTRSDLWRNLLRNDGRMRIPVEEGMSSEAVAAGILRALVKNRAETILGLEARKLLLAHKFIPWFLERMINRRVRQLYEHPASESVTQGSEVRDQKSEVRRERVR